MAITRTIIREGLTRRETAQGDDVVDLAELLAPEPAKIDQHVEFAETVLAAAGLPTVDGIALRRARDRAGLHSREWFAAELLRHVAGVKNHAKAGQVDQAIDWAIGLGEVFMLMQIKLGLERDVIFGRRRRDDHRDGARKANAKRKANNDAMVARVTQLVAQQGLTVTAACLRVANHNHARAAALRKAYGRRKRK